MGRPVTMFTGQWADLPLETLAQKVQGFGYDGMELACWGDHFEIDKALAEDDYCEKKRALLEKYNLQVFAISAHLVGQAVLDNIDARHKAIVPPYVWGDAGRRQSARGRGTQDAAERAELGSGYRQRFHRFEHGSALQLAPVPPSRATTTLKLAERFNPILDVFGEARRGSP